MIQWLHKTRLYKVKPADSTSCIGLPNANWITIEWISLKYCEQRKTKNKTSGSNARWQLPGQTCSKMDLAPADHFGAFFFRSVGWQLRVWHPLTAFSSIMTRIAAEGHELFINWKGLLKRSKSMIVSIAILAFKTKRRDPRMHNFGLLWLICQNEGSNPGRDREGRQDT